MSRTPDEFTAPGSEHGLPMVWFEPFRFDFTQRLLYRDDREVPLPPRALSVLAFLLERPGLLVSKHSLVDAVWKDATVTETSLIEAISVVRQALGDDPQQPRFIQTVHRRGYRFVAEVAYEPPVALEAAPAPEAASSHVPPVRLGGDIQPMRAPSWRIAAGAVLIASLAMGLAWLSRAGAPDEAGLTIRAILPMAPPVARIPQPAIALAPDGAHIAYVGESNGERRLYLRELQTGYTREVRGSRDATAPFFAPDGDWVGFFAEAHLKKVHVRDGDVVTLAGTSDPHGGTWVGSVIVFAPDGAGGLWRMDAAGGPASRLTITNAAAGERGHGWPQAMPRRDAVLATVWRGQGPEVRAFSLITGQPLAFSMPGSYARPLANGALVLVQDGRVVLRAFEDADPGSPPERAPVVLQAIAVDAATGTAQFACSNGGVLVYLSPRDPGSSMHLVVDWFNEIGRSAFSLTVLQSA